MRVPVLIAALEAVLELRIAAPIRIGLAVIGPRVALQVLLTHRHAIAIARIERRALHGPFAAVRRLASVDLPISPRPLVVAEPIVVAGLEAVFPSGTVTRVKNVPRRAAGPDIRHVIVGSEGALCFITEVTVKLFRYQPENNRYFGFLVDEFADGIAALRELITAGYRPSVCRVYSPEDARQHFAGFYQGKNVVVLVAEGPKGIADATAEAIEEFFAARPHERVDSGLIRQWFENLNWGQDKIDAEKAAMLEHSHLGYTTEVSVSWSRVTELFDAVMHRIRGEFPRAGDLTMLGAHSSHSYQTGTNLYFVYDYTIRCSPREEIEVYHKPLNAIIVEEALRLGGSMVHHHGIGKYRTPWVREEHGSAWYLLSTLKHAFDPEGVMNAGTIFPLEPGAGRRGSPS